jgi:hypothetical protein
VVRPIPYLGSIQLNKAPGYVACGFSCWPDRTIRSSRHDAMNLERKIRQDGLASVSLSYASSSKTLILQMRSFIPVQPPGDPSAELRGACRYPRPGEVPRPNSLIRGLAAKTPNR